VKSNPALAPSPVTPPLTSWDRPPIALFWDQSLIWGLICVETLQQLQVPFRLVSAAEIARGILDDFRVLLIPGGWAAHKMHVLGKAGQEQIRQFVSNGGSYLGFCGGAGLALSSPPSLGLVPLERLPLQDRLPSASGQVFIAKVGDHPIWQDSPVSLPASIWWPSQFKWQPMPSVQALASYATLGEDFWIADLPLSDLEMQDMDCAVWEEVYGINLNPARLLDQPAIIESQLGQGRLVLCYPHLETPGNAAAHRLLVNILRYLDDAAAPFFPKDTAVTGDDPSGSPSAHSRQTLDYLQRAEDKIAELIRFGERHLLWNWRLPWLLHWRRGIRGLEYGTMAVLLRVAMREAQQGEGSLPQPDIDPLFAPANQLYQDVAMFCSHARQLLLEEKLAGQIGICSKLGQVNEAVDRLRAQLFGTQMNHGGLCRAIFDQLDLILYRLLTIPGPESRL
jgi:hypothetical protein